MAGYVYRGTGGDDEPNPSTAMTAEQKDRLAIAVLHIVASLDASLAASAQRRFAAMERSCCGACGALFVGGSCDVCRLRLERAA